MPRSNNFWPVILLLCGCAPFLKKQNDFERGLQLYEKKEYEAAVEYFEAYHTRHPHFDSALYYLFNCHKQLNNPEAQISVLEKLVRGNTADENVYLNLIYYYRKYERPRDLYTLLSEYPESLQDDLDSNIVLTRQLLAELICGAATRTARTDPMIYTVSKGYLPRFPDGQLYAGDTLSYAHFIVLLDRLVEPEYPRNLYPMKHLSTKSYLYLPYMRLVDAGIIQFDAYLMPENLVPLSTAVRAVGALAKRGYFD